MAKDYVQDRLLPSLLDRLTDNNPNQNFEAVEFKVYSLKQLRENVLRDLSWLLNATSNKYICQESSNIRLQNSVLNFGMPALSGSFLSGISLGELRQQIRQAVLIYEPRIIADSIQIAVKDFEENQHNQVSFDIKAQLWAQPAPIELLINSAIDLETGETTIVEVDK